MIKQIIIFFFAMILLSSCKKYYFLSCDKEVSNSRWLFDSIRTHYKISNKEKYILKKIEWNNKCNCGLIDVTKNIKHSYNYFPILVFKDKTLSWLINSNSEKIVNADIVFKKFTEQHSDFFSEEQFKLMQERINKKTIHFGSSILMSSLDLKRDSILLNKYLSQNDTVLKINK